MHNDKVPTLSIHRIYNAFPLHSITPNDYVQAFWNDPQYLFFAFFAIRPFLVFKTGAYKNPHYFWKIKHPL